MKKERPIIFGTESIKAILDGSKTMTRRVVKHRKWFGEPDWSQAFVDTGFVPQGGVPYLHVPQSGGQYGDKTVQSIHCPHGVPGDVLWVRETFMLFEQTPTMCSTNGGPFIPTGEIIPGGYGYRADLDNCGQVPVTDETGSCLRTPKDRWKSPRFMPRAASRITLEITDVRVERLQDISEIDCENELGVHPYALGNDAYSTFRERWDAINKKTPFESNPWVWVIEFKKISGGKEIC